MSFFENINSVFETKFNVVPKPGGGSSGGAGDWNTLANRPFGYTEHYDLLKETAVTFSGSDPAIGGLSLSASLTEGMAYPVNFDGTQYLCRYESGKLGNLALEDGIDTGEPFLWYVTESMILTTAGAGTHTVSLQGDVPQKIPWDYLPFGYETFELLSETTLPAENNSGFYMSQFQCVNMPQENRPASVYFNGSKYICDVLKKGLQYAIGNLSLLGAGADTGEPFIISIDSEYQLGMIASTTPAETFTLRIIAEKAQKLTPDLVEEVKIIDLESLGIPRLQNDVALSSVEITPEIYSEFTTAVDTKGYVKLKLQMDVVFMNGGFTCTEAVCFLNKQFSESSFAGSVIIGKTRLDLDISDTNLAYSYTRGD